MIGQFTARAALLTLGLQIASGQAGPPSGWKFTDVDDKLLVEVAEVDRQFDKKGLILQDPELTAYLENIGNRIWAERQSPERVKFKFRILRDPMVNAFAMPNGSIYVNTGLLAAVENEAQLASVLSHEISHVTHRHTYLHNRSNRKKSVMIHIFAAAGAAGGYFPAGSVFGTALSVAGSVSQVLVMASVFGYSQDLEREADRMGFDLLTQSRYDGRAMPRTFEILDEKLEVEPVESFWRTHPKLQERIVTTKGLASAMPAEGALESSEREYVLKVAPAIRYNVTADLMSRRPRTALARASRLMKWDGENPATRVLVADAYRLLGAKSPEPTDDELTRRGQKDHKNRLFKMTLDEEQRELTKRPEGLEARKANYEKSRLAYLDIIAKHPDHADAQRGIGMLYEDLAQDAEALQAYRRYLELAPPDALDRLRIERRIERLDRKPLGRESEAAKP